MHHSPIIVSGIQRDYCPGLTRELLESDSMFAFVLCHWTRGGSGSIVGPKVRFNIAVALGEGRPMVGGLPSLPPLT